MTQEPIDHTRETPAGLITGDGHPIPLLGVKIHGRLQGRAVELTVTQRYRNGEDSPLEGVYLFPLPDEAAVCGLTVRTGDRVLRGRVEEREQAFDLYDEAMAEGHGAVLLDQERPNVFQMSVGNLLPGQEALVEVRMVYLAAVSSRALRLMIPAAVAPRYASSSLSTEQLREFERTAPPYALAVPYGMTLEIEAEAASPIRSLESPSHPIRSEVDGRRARVTLSRGDTAMDRDFVLTLETEDPHQPGALVARFNDRDHILLEVNPELPAASDAAPRNVCFLVDCSGSMNGDSIAEARQAVQRCLWELREGDRFQVVRFGTSHTFLFRQPKHFSRKALEQAIDRLEAMEADMGGTEILAPLEAVADRYRGRRVDLLLLTDGQVAAEEEVLAFAQAHRTTMRIFSFGIGAGSSEFLVSGLARATGGRSEFIHPGERIGEKVLRQFTRIDSPALEQLNIDWGGMKVEQSPAEVPPVFAGDGLVVTARLSKNVRLNDGASIILSGKAPASAVVWEVPAVRTGDDSSPIPLLWARERLRELETGFGAPAGSRQKRGGDRRRKALVDLSREYGLVCSETSFVAVEERADDKRAEGPAVLRQVPVAVTRGWHGLGSARGALAGAFASMDRERRCNTYDRADSVQFQRRSSSPPPPSFFGFQKTVSPEEIGGILWCRALFGEQQANGSFPLSDTLLNTVGLSRADTAPWLKRFSFLRHPEEVLATALVIALLREKATLDHTWKKKAKRAIAWLKKQRGIYLDRLLEELKDLVDLTTLEKVPFIEQKR